MNKKIKLSLGGGFLQAAHIVFATLEERVGSHIMIHVPHIVLTVVHAFCGRILQVFGAGGGFFAELNHAFGLGRKFFKIVCMFFFTVGEDGIGGTPYQGEGGQKYQTGDATSEGEFYFLVH